MLFAADEKTWIALAALRSTYVAFVLVLFPMELSLALLQASTSIVDSTLRSKGTWRFWFETYRPIAMSWTHLLESSKVPTEIIAKFGSLGEAVTSSGSSSSVDSAGS